MKVLGNWVWVKPIHKATETSSGLTITVDKIKPTTGVVIAIGNKCDEVMLGPVEVGDTVSFDPMHIRAQEHPITGEEVFRFQDRNLDYKIL